MKKKVIFILLVMTLLTTLSANKSIEELEKRLKGTKENDRLILLVKLTESSLRTNPQKATDYGNQALALLKQYPEKNVEAGILDQLAQAYNLLGDYPNALKITESRLLLALEIKDQKMETNSLNFKAIIYIRKGSHKQARELSLQALEMAQKISNREEEAGALNNIGISYDMQGNYKKALEYYLKSLAIKEALGNRPMIASSLNNIGVIHKLLGNNNEALKYYQRALKIREELGNLRGIAAVCNNMGNIYWDLKEKDKVIEYYSRTIEIDKKLNNQPGVASTLFNIGWQHYDTGDYAQALNYFEQSLAIREKLGEKGRIAKTLVEIGKTYGKMGRSRSSIRFISRGLEVALENGSLEIQQNGYLALSSTYESIGSFRKALTFYKQFKETAEKISDGESRQKIAEIQARYEADKKEKEILLLKKNNQIQELMIARQKMVRNRLIAGGVLILLVIGFLIYKFRYIFTFWKKKHYIGHYKIIEQMGSGGMGTVYRARDVMNSSTSIAIKVLREEYFADEVQKKRFKQEASIIDQMAHPNIVKVIERGESDGNLYIAMELLQGPTLAQKIEEEKKLKISTALSIMAQVADALQSIHALNIIHRDLKPENIMLIEKEANPNYVKLLDFGLATAQHLSRLTETGNVIGTIYYLSPEQIGGNTLGPASDIHALGAIYYEMLTGYKPYIGETSIDIMKQIATTRPIDPVQLRPEINKGLCDLVMFMLQKDPAMRPDISTIASILEGMVIHSDKT